MVARVYIRLSQLREGEEKLSPEIQLNAAKAKALASGWTLDEQSSLDNQDLNVSGYSVQGHDRPGLARHFRDLEAGLFNVLIVLALDRLGRNAADTLTLIKRIEDAGGIFVSCKEGIETGTSTGKLLTTILAGVAENESDNISSRIQANVDARAKAGKYHGGRLPFWIGRDSDGNFELIEPQASILRLAIERRLAGESVNTIAREINALGYRTKSGTPFERSYLAKFVSNSSWIDTMAGTAIVRRPGRKQQGRAKSRKEPITIPGLYPALIDEETANRLKLTISIPHKLKENRNRVTKNWLLNSILKCQCGSRMETHGRHTEKGYRRTYICQRHADNPTPEHGLSRVDAGLIERAVLAAIAHEFDLASASELEPIKLPNVRTEDVIRTAIENLMPLIERGGLTAEAAMKRLAELEDELNHIRLTNLNPPEIKPMEATMTIQEARQVIRDLEIEVSYPHYSPLIKIESGKPRACAKIKAERWNIDCLAPIYNQKWAGPRVIFKREGEHVYKETLTDDDELAQTILSK